MREANVWPNHIRNPWAKLFLPLGLGGGTVSPLAGQPKLPLWQEVAASDDCPWGRREMPKSVGLFPISFRSRQSAHLAALNNGDFGFFVSGRKGAIA
jgi:hypothetical protein